MDGPVASEKFQHEENLHVPEWTAQHRYSERRELSLCTEWESYSSIYSSSEAEVFEGGTILPKSGTLWFYTCREPPKWLFDHTRSGQQPPHCRTQELRCKTTWNSSERTTIQWLDNQDTSSHCCPGLLVPFFLEENYSLKKRLQQRGILLPQVLITDFFKP